MDGGKVNSASKVLKFAFSSEGAVKRISHTHLVFVVLAEIGEKRGGDNHLVLDNHRILLNLEANQYL